MLTFPSRRKLSSPSLLSGSTSDSSRSYSSWISPTISSTTSSMVIRPAVPPYSSTTMAMCRLVTCISCSSSSTAFVSGT